jgi:MOSC domain-containing protein YiiM
MGKLTGIYSSSGKDQKKLLIESGELIVDHGLQGDSHAGRDLNRQVSLFAAETLSELQSEGFEVSAEDLNANLLTERIKLNLLRPGAQIRVGETVIEIAAARKPCRLITNIDNRLPKRLYGQCGQLGRIVKGGMVRAGDEVEVLADKSHPKT